MDIKGNGVEVRVNAADQSDDWLISAAQEIADAAQERGLELPFAAGAVAVGGAMQAEAETATEVEAPTYETKESIVEQLSFAHKGYQAVVNSLNDGRKKDKLIVGTEETLATEFENWFTADKLALVVAAQEANPNVRFTLVATPNVSVDHQNIIKAAKAFGQYQPYETYIFDNLYKKYSAEELSGTNQYGNAVQFSLISNSFTPEMSGTASAQLAKLAKLQAENPDLKVPSVLDAVTYWQTLRARGEQLADNTTFDRTYIRHFDLPEQRFDDWSGVPYSFVSDVGGPYLLYSGVQDGSGGRLSVG